MLDKSSCRFASISARCCERRTIFIMRRLNPTYSECKNCAFRIRCSRLSASTIAYLYMSFRDSGVVFFDANLRSSSISTPTVFSDIVAVASDGEEDRDIDMVSADADAEESLGFVGSTYDERDNDDEIMGFFHPDAVGFLFPATSGFAVARACTSLCVVLRDESCLLAEVNSLTPLTRHIFVDDSVKFCCVEHSTMLEKTEVNFRCWPFFW